MNEKIEELFPNPNTIDISHSINTSEVVPEQTEIIAVDDYGKVDSISFDYNEYRSTLVSFYKQTTKDNSIISTFIIDETICNHTVTLRSITDTQEVKSNKKFDYNNNFINTFLIPMVEDYNRENVVFDSVIEVLDENKSNFIARTKSNDSLIIMGISIELANQFKDIVTKNDIPIETLDKKESSERGIGSSLAIILTIVAIGMCLIGTIFLFTNLL